MCGFVGIISKTSEPFQEDTLRRMTSIISHRGPDDEAFFRHGDWLAMGFRRLKIIDLSDNARQPMLSNDGRHAIIFNGEIYNYRELRIDLEDAGIEFRSDSDTEVLLNAYLQWGEACFDKLVGMFAFVIADIQERKIVAARDHLGIKPLYIFEDDKFRIFCSEVKSLLPYTELQPNTAAFNEYLIFRSLVGGRTMFENVRELPPGHIAEVSASKFEQHQYFDLPNTIQRSSISFEEATKRTEDKLRGSVELHMRSDVELGVQLSGGVDSSLITAIAAEKAKKKLHTFSVSFPDIPEYDESEYQKRISQRYGTEHHDYPMTEEEFATELDQTIWHYEHPLNDPNSVSSMVLAQHAKKQVTVMLSGEGADESFLGYTKFTPKALKTIRKRGFLWRHPGIRETLARLTGKPIFKVTRYDPAMFALSYADLNSVDDLIHGNYPEMSGRLEASFKAGGNIEKNVVLQDQMCDLPQWFQRADKTGMAASMELRVPFCTNGTFSLANSTPYEHHVSNAERKRVLKKVAENYMDHDQIYRKKIGFNTPLQVWMEPNRKYRKMLEQTLDEAIENKRPGVDIQHMAGLLDELKAGRRVERQCAFLWTYMNLERWHRIFFEGGWKKF